MSTQGYSGASYDRWVERQDTSTFHKMKETFWTTKQAVIQKLGKKEDAHVVASDSELDSKLEVFKAIQKSSMDLLRAIEKYQDRLCGFNDFVGLSMEENGTGRFLKGHSGQDKTRAGKMMAAVGKSQSFAAQQRLALRVPLVRLYQEVETFRYRAISDTLMTINRMEGARTEYRGALLWMKDVSEQLDPDTYKQLEKFRKVQAQVKKTKAKFDKLKLDVMQKVDLLAASRCNMFSHVLAYYQSSLLNKHDVTAVVQAQVKKTKAKFDKLKLDVMQKVDLLAASRCNMFSHVLANYQSSLLHFWEKTSRTMTAVAESFKGYQYYEFSIIKELQEPNKKLSEHTSNRQPAEKEIDDDFDPEKLISLEEEKVEEGEPADENTSLHNLYTGAQTDTSNKEQTEKSVKENRTQPNESTDTTEPFLDFGEEDLKLDDDSEFAGQLTKIEKKAPPKNVPKDLLSEELEVDDTDKDDMTILNEILNAPSASGEDDFSLEWQAVFGHNTLGASGATLTPGETDQSQKSAEFMPSNLLDVDLQLANVNLNNTVPTGGSAMSSPGVPQNPNSATNTSQNKQSQQKPKSKKGQKADMSAWFNLFADLDPLADPDAIGKQMEDMTDA